MKLPGRKRPGTFTLVRSRAGFSGEQLATILLLAACGAPTTPAAPRPPTTSQATAAVLASPPQKRAPRYVISTRRPAQGQDEASLTLRHALVDGARFVTRGGFLERSLTSTDPPLVGVARVPEHLGNGFLFWNRRALFRARTFTGDLTPLADVGAQPTHVSFGPDFLLVQTDEGRWVLDAKSGARKSSGLSGLIDAAALADGRALALTSTGDALVSRDAGKHWTSVRDRLTSPVRELREHDGDLWLVERAGEALLLETSGRVSRHTAPKSNARPLVDQRWTLPQTPLEVAAGSGASLDDGRAVLTANGALATVDLETGELGLTGRALLPAGSECRLLPTTGKPLLLCSGAALTVFADPIDNPHIERTFVAGAGAAFAESTLVIGASCAGDRDLGLVCVRQPNGEYRDFDRKIEVTALADAKSPGAPVAADFALEWVPKRGGGAVAIVSRPKPALIDAATGSIVFLPKDSASDILSTISDDSKPVVTSRVVTEQGAMIGYGKNRSFMLSRDGRLSDSPFKFSALRGFDAHVLAVDNAQRYFESGDFGLTFQEVESPPGKGGPEACSDVGCRATNWLRLGWGPAPPKQQPPVRVVPSPPLYEAPRRPRLDCRERGAPALSTRTLAAAGDDATFDFGFGGRQVLLADGTRSFFRELFGALDSTQNGLWALVYARLPEVANSPELGVVPASPDELERQKTIYAVRAFDAKAKVGVSHVTWKKQVRAALDVGGRLPNLEVSDQEEGAALPVAAAPPRYADGFVLKENGPALWVRDQKEPKPISLGNGRDDLELVDAVSPKAGDLVLLSVDDEEQGHVIAVTSHGISQLLEYPVKASALAVDAHGEVALFFAPTGVEPPSADDPALIVHPGGTVQKLPPWSTLKPASAAECAASDDDYRVLIRAKRSWLELIEASNPQSRQGEVPEMLALVRVNGTRFCLEAVELTAAAVDSLEFSIPTRIVARFAAAPSAGRVGIALGAEFRQPLSCDLR